MSVPNAKALIQSIRQPGKDEQGLLFQWEKIEDALAMETIKEWLEQMKPWIEAVEDPTLQQWVHLAFVGTCVGFFERKLHPLIPSHHYIYPKIIKDLTEMYECLKKENIEYDPKYLKFQVYDFGVQSVYYLDWKLYMSKECY